MPAYCRKNVWTATLALTLSLIFSAPRKCFSIKWRWDNTNTATNDANTGVKEKPAPPASDTSPGDTGVEYGVDVSFPVHHWKTEDKETNPLGDRQGFYDDFLGGCTAKYPGTICSHTELDRVKMSLRQPLSMQVGARRVREFGIQNA